MELTHFERVFKGCEKHFNKAAHFAKKSIDKPDYVQCLREAVRVPSPPENASEEVVTRGVVIASQKAVACCHCLTMELLRRDNTYSFSALSDDKRYSSLVRVASAASDKIMLNTAGHMHYHMAAHNLAGKRVYAPSSGLAEQLRHTELRGLTTGDLKLPYPSVYLQVPKSANLEVWNHETDWHRVIGIYITEELEPRAWRFLACGEVKPPRFSAVHNMLVDDNDALVYFAVQLPKDMALDDALQLTQEECIKHSESMVKEGVDTFNPMIDRWQDIFRWSMNVILYASMPDKEVEKVTGNKEARQLLDRASALPKGKKRAKLFAKAKEIDPRRRYMLGNSVTSRRGGWMLTVRFRVRGHWRNQPYGPERMWRRLQWIEPYWKGPEAGISAENSG